MPGKKQLITVQDFFRFAEEQGRQFFDELDSDGDGVVQQADVARMLRKRNLPEKYARNFIDRARGNRWWQTTVTWEQYQALMDERESKLLRAYTSMQVNDQGNLEAATLKESLTKMGVEASSANAAALLKAMGVESNGVVSYSNFRNFVMLLPAKKLDGLDPNLLWFNAASSIPFGPPPDEEGRERKGPSFLLAAMAGAIASGSSTLVMHPVDTLKTRLQSDSTATLASVARSARQSGLRGLYKGIAPAFTGNAMGHGVRTCAYETSLAALSSLSGGAAELQMQGLASGVGTVLGTCIKIPCDLLKQRLQVGRHDNVVQAVKAAGKSGGLYRGTAAVFAREVPFYVLGMVGFEQIKRFAQGSFKHGTQKELAPWEVILIGGVAGMLAAVATTPADVVKTRIMTSAIDQRLTAGGVLKDVLAKEGPLGLFRGALPRAIWTGPQGAMHFAGYELAKNALAGSKQKRQSPVSA
ncbi:hypothetical protein WJX73_004404 [Symbiochloris irregularis]|uniref:EF-hand domain-containing protein n=1 Tax=Symbiochloris irregularis TaxID=706552 RepID=A0AAW1PCL6_9CHLO